MGNLRFEPIQLMLQLRRKPEDLAMMCDRRQYCLTDPPTCIRDETYAAIGIETRHGFDETEIAFVDKFVKRIAGSRILFRHRHDETQVGFNEFSESVLIASLNTLAEILFLFRCQLRKAGNVL